MESMEQTAGRACKRPSSNHGTTIRKRSGTQHHAHAKVGEVRRIVAPHTGLATAWEASAARGDFVSHRIACPCRHSRSCNGSSLVSAGAYLAPLHQRYQLKCWPFPTTVCLLPWHVGPATHVAVPSHSVMQAHLTRTVPHFCAS